MATTTFLTFNQFPEKHCAFRLGGLRHQKFNEKTNGLKEIGAFVNVGRSVLIHEERYFLAIELKNTGEFDSVVNLIREAKKQGKYLSPEDAVALTRGSVAA